MSELHGTRNEKTDTDHTSLKSSFYEQLFEHVFIAEIRRKWGRYEFKRHIGDWREGFDSVRRNMMTTAEKTASRQRELLHGT
ncbi:MAG: hypothetical protein JSS02_17545 [Planctomycetes bacterium]|nr:hypothetical protein [Planctomycetota bacterium]